MPGMGPHIPATTSIGPCDLDNHLSSQEKRHLPVEVWTPTCRILTTSKFSSFLPQFPQLQHGCNDTLSLWVLEVFLKNLSGLYFPVFLFHRDAYLVCFPAHA